MSIPSIFGNLTLLLPKSTLSRSPNSQIQLPQLRTECSSRPRKKATAHRLKTRPRKTRRWDMRRKPAVYSSLFSLPTDLTPVSSYDVDGDGGFATEAALPSAPSLQAPIASG
ncbi:hypothetical protein MANES_05G185700v8 [Manihot esculenta]|uniref:Uncharacterized protein n=1 Tax=Manihot esculenta TaxID=3983 RepID=A0A2C9VXK9_MANES|nr:hypothetical protein MANES_05G185700v8 [Manihot esculenta]